MKIETEITVLVKTSYDNLKKELLSKEFEIKEEYEVNDDYLIDSKLNLSNMSNLDILKKCILVRDVVGIEKELLYKYKEYDSNGDIIKQGKVKCPIMDTSKAIDFMMAIDYKKLFSIHDKCIVFANDRTQIIVQLINNKYIFIEMESTGEFINREYINVEEMKEDLLSYNLPIDSSNFFAKKAEIILNEVLNK